MIKIYVFIFIFLFFSVLISCLFLQFEDSQDAEDAIRGRDGYDFDGYRLRVGYMFTAL